MNDNNKYYLGEPVAEFDIENFRKDEVDLEETGCDAMDTSRPGQCHVAGACEYGRLTNFSLPSGQ
jgi:hypothetical protein